MSITVQIDSTARVVFSIFRGAISEPEFREAVEGLSKQTGFDPGFTHLIDLTETTRFDVSTSFLHDLGLRESIFNRSSPQIVVAPHSHIFGLARMVQIYRDVRQRYTNIEVVRSRAEAYKILGLNRGLDENTQSRRTA